MSSDRANAMTHVRVHTQRLRVSKVREHCSLQACTSPNSHSGTQNIGRCEHCSPQASAPRPSSQDARRHTGNTASHRQAHARTHNRVQGGTAETPLPTGECTPERTRGCRAAQQNHRSPQESAHPSSHVASLHIGDIVPSSCAPAALAPTLTRTSLCMMPLACAPSRASITAAQ